ncbi:GFA family protein [Brucellaceae bacterium C25G]
MQCLEGGCLCGHIRFSTTSAPDFPHTCSCTMCQLHTGALTAAWVEFSGEDVKWTGVGGVPATYRSSEQSSRAFCPECGSSIGAIDDSSVIALLTGVFDKPYLEQLKPASHSFVDTRPHWWNLAIDDEDQLKSEV